MEWVEKTCIQCGIHFCITEEYHKLRLNDNDDFFCPNGHGFHYIKKNTKTEKQLLKENEELIKNNLSLLSKLEQTETKLLEYEQPDYEQ